MTKPAEKTTAVSTTFTTPGDGVRDLLKDLRGSEELTATPGGVRLMQRVEDVLTTMIERSGLGESQITNAAAMRAYMEFGTFVSKGSATLPDHLKNNPADCTAIAMRADRWGLDFYGVAEKTHIIQGKLGYESQLIGAVLKNMGAVQGSPHDEYFGDWTKILGKFTERESKSKKDDHGHPKKYKVPAWKETDEDGLGIRFWNTLTGETEPRFIEVLMSQALVRNSTLWTTNPQQQIFYLAQKLWARKYAPEAILGVNTVDDLEEKRGARNMGDAEIVGAESGGLSEDVLGPWRAAAGKGTEAAKAYWGRMTVDQRRAASADLKAAMWAIAEEADAKRTVENPVSAPAPAAATATASASPPAAEPAAAAKPETATQAADQETGEVDPAFIAGMDKVEAKDAKK